jgi:hypothetical protein
MLGNLGKNFSLKSLTRTAQIIREMDLPAMWFFIFGGPGESEATIDETFSFIDKYIFEEDMVHVTSGLRIYPGTALAQRAKIEGRFALADGLLKPLFYFPEELPHERLLEILQKKCSTRPNCVLSSESAPPAEMMAAAQKLRMDQNLDEPMFRTLLRIRRERMNAKG